eukprot:g76233.t1
MFEVSRKFWGWVHSESQPQYGADSKRRFEQEKDVVTLLHMSDTHMLLSPDQFVLPPADVLVHTGDFTNRGWAQEFAGFDAFLSAMANIYPARVVIFGNHDCSAMAGDFERMRAALPHASHVLMHGLRIYGSPWYWGHSWDYRNRSKADPPAWFARVPANTDVLLTHGPARGMLDESDGIKGNHTGSVAWAKAISEAKPLLHLFGHIHEQSGFVLEGKGQLKATCFVNSAMKNRWGRSKIQQGPHLITLRRRKTDKAAAGQRWEVVSVEPVPLQSKNKKVDTCHIFLQ